MLSSPLWNGIPQFAFDPSFKNGIFIEEITYSDIEDKQGLIEATLDCSDWRQINLFMSCGNLYNNSNTRADGDCRPYSFIYDWGAIYSAFLQQYGIDLLENDMHYWKFMQLFNGLRNTIFNEIVDIRTTDASEIKDTQAKQKMLELQDYYKLPNYFISEEERLAQEFDNKFNN